MTFGNSGRRLAACLIGALGVLVLPAEAQPVAIKVCLPDIDAPPYFHRDAQKPGVFNRLLVDAGRQAGVAVSVLRLPSARCRLALASGEVDAMPLPAIPAYMAQLAFPLGPQGQLDSASRIGRIQFLLLHRRGETPDWDGQRLNPPGVLVGVRRGVTTLAEKLQSLGAVLDDKASANDQLLKKLMARRIDLAAMSREEFLAVAATQPSIEASALPLISTDLYVAVSRRLPEDARERVTAWREEIVRMRDLPGYRPDDVRARAP